MPKVDKEGALVTGRSSHEIYVIEDGKRRWVPDSWTMRNAGLSPNKLVIEDDKKLDVIPLGDPLPSAIPAPKLKDGEIIESEDGVFTVKDGKLHRVVDPRELVVQGKPPKRVTFLPASLCRGIYYTGEGS